MAEYTLSNQQVTVCIDEHASEIHSFKDNHTGIEYMWQGDPAYWAGRNPTLFPMVGSTWDKKLHINGREYVTGNHGFARHSDFKCIEKDDTHLIMELKDSEETRQQYPFSFTMHILYVLRQNELMIHYEITNDGNESMPFHFGLHPAFNCPLDPKRSFDSYQIELNHAEEIPQEGNEPLHTDVIPLDRGKLKKTIIITNPKSTEASLSDGKHKVTVHYEGYEWLAFWSPEAPFVCIEPWHSHTDFSEVKVPFEKREGAVTLEPHHRWTTDYTIRVE